MSLLNNPGVPVASVVQDAVADLGEVESLTALDQVMHSAPLCKEGYLHNRQQHCRWKTSGGWIHLYHGTPLHHTTVLVGPSQVQSMDRTSGDGQRTGCRRSVSQRGYEAHISEFACHKMLQSRRQHQRLVCSAGQDTQIAIRCGVSPPLKVNLVHAYLGSMHMCISRLH